MIAVTGTYDNGFVKLDKDFLPHSPIKVIVTFLEDVQVEASKRLNVSDFSFLKSQEALKDYTGNLGDSVIEERRNEF